VLPAGGSGETAGNGRGDAPGPLPGAGDAGAGQQTGAAVSGADPLNQTNAGSPTLPNVKAGEADLPPPGSGTTLSGPIGDAGEAGPSPAHREHHPPRARVRTVATRRTRGGRALGPEGISRASDKASVSPDAYEAYVRRLEGARDEVIDGLAAKHGLNLDLKPGEKLEDPKTRKAVQKTLTKARREEVNAKRTLSELRNDEEALLRVAALSAAAYKLNGKDLRFDQLVGVIAMARDGHIVNMATGEGKTLVEGMAVAIWSTSRGGAGWETIHTKLVNDFLDKNSPAYQLLGIKYGRTFEGQGLGAKRWAHGKRSRSALTTRSASTWGTTS